MPDWLQLKIDVVIALNNGITYHIQVSCSEKSKQVRQRLADRNIINIAAGKDIQDAVITHHLSEILKVLEISPARSNV